MDCDIQNQQIVIIGYQNNLYCFAPTELVRMINDNPPNVVEMKIANFVINIAELAYGLKKKFNTFKVGSEHIYPIDRSSVTNLNHPTNANPNTFSFMKNVPDYIEDRKRFWNRYDDRIVIIPERYNVANLEKLIRDEEKVISIYQEFGKGFKIQSYKKILENVNPETGLSYTWYSYTTNDPTMFPTRMLAQFGSYQMMHRNMRTYMGYFDYYYDIDVENAHPSIAIQWLQRYADIEKFPTLVRYATKRQSMFEVLFAPPYNFSRDVAKRLLLEVFNSKKVQKKMKLEMRKLGESDIVIKEPPKFLYDLYEECIEAQKVAVSQFPSKYQWYIDYNINKHPWFKSFKEGVQSKYLLKKARVHCWQTMLTYVENLCLFNMWNSLYDLGYNPRTLIFDGLGVEKHPDLNPDFELSRRVLDTLSNLIFERCGYRIKLEIKSAPPVLPKLEELFSEQQSYVENVENYNSVDLTQEELAIVRTEIEHNISYEDMLDTSDNIGRFLGTYKVPTSSPVKEEERGETDVYRMGERSVRNIPPLFPEEQNMRSRNISQYKNERQRYNESAYDSYLRERR